MLENQLGQSINLFNRVIMNTTSEISIVISMNHNINCHTHCKLNMITNNNDANYISQDKSNYLTNHKFDIHN